MRYPARQRRKRILAAVIVTAGAGADPALARDAASETTDTVDIAIAAEVIDFGYREFDRGGRELNREDGLLPGLRLTARAAQGRAFARIDASYHGGTVDYDGETQSGTPTRTETGTRLFSVGAEAGVWLGQRPGKWGGFVHLARRLWERDIYSTGNVQGIYEEYRWSEFGLGLRHVWSRAGKASWGHEISVMAYRVTDGDIFVELSGLSGPDWDDTTLSLGNENGLRLRYTATRRLGDGKLLRIEPYYAEWAFGRSNTETVTSDGQPTGFSVTEPRSESRRIGVTLALVF